MRCKIKMLSVNGIPASDGSLVTADVMNDYINSQECKKALANHTMMGSLTHRCRNIATVFPDKPELKKTVGKDDSLLIVNTEAPTPTHYIDDLFIEGGWLWGYITILPEDGFDDLGKQNIRRLKALLNNGVRLGGSCVIVIITDVGCITDEICEAISKADYLVIEANHDVEMLKSGPYPEYLKKRIASRSGHLSNTDCGTALAENMSEHLRHVWLCHLSEENNHPELARKTVEAILRSHGVIPGKDVTIEILRRTMPTGPYELV